MSSPSIPASLPTDYPAFETPPRATLPRSQPPRHQSTPAISSNTKQSLGSIAMATTASLPSAPLPISRPPSTASTSTESSSSSFRPATTPATSHNLGGPSRPLSPPQKVRPLTSSGPSSSATTGYGGVNSTSASLATAVQAILPPQTGASKMAAAAKRGATGVDGLPRSRRGSQAVPVGEEDHPLSEKCLKAKLVPSRSTSSPQASSMTDHS